MPVSLGSQDVHHSAVLSAILQPIRDLNENWKVDLSTHLETYLREICEQQDGIGSVNFVEAALLIQRSAGIYVKKVDYLWNLLLQVLESFRKKGVPGEKNPERRKKSANISELFQDFVEIPVSTDKKIWKRKECTVTLDPPYYSELEYNCPRDKKLSLFDHMLDPVGDKSDFRLNYPISSTFMLEEELSFLDTFESNCVNIELTECEENDSPGGSNDCMVQGDLEADDGVNNDDNLCSEAMEVEPEPNAPDSSIGRAENREIVNPVNPPKSPSDVWNSEAGSIPDKSLKFQERYKLPSVTLEKKKKGITETTVSSLVTDNISVNFGNRYEEFPKFRNEFLKEFKNKKKTVKELQKVEEVEEYRKSLASDFPADFLYFVDLEASTEDNAEFVGYPDQEEVDRDDNNDPFPNEDDIQEEALVNVANFDDADEWGLIYQNILQEKMHSARIDNQDSQAKLASRVNQWHESIRSKLKEAEERNCMDIHEYGTRILNNFPQENGKRSKVTIDFAEVVKDEEQEEISRYFLACLLLANNYNIEITASDPSDLAMNCMELTLLKSTRHHETLESYQAPSQSETGTQRRSRN